jgi:FtsZ-binding cell division protein ZapB
MANANESLPNTDDIPAVASNSQTEQELLDAVLSNSSFVQESLPDEEIPEVDSSESDYEDPDESDEVVNEESEEVEEEAEEEDIDEDGDEESPTQNSDVFTADDLDLDAQVVVKINGEEVPVSFSDLIKGYSTEQSLSAKGREIGEARKELEAERESKLAKITQLGQASSLILYQEEQTKASAYHELEAQIKKARDEGDTYELSELKDKREQVQSEYWEARRKREGLLGQLENQQKELEEKKWQEEIQNFNTTITEYIPDFNEEVASDIRSFALDEGLPEELIDSITDPSVVKFVNEFRKLKTGVSKGQAKRKQVVAKKVPVKKAKPTNKKKADADSMVKARAFREDASNEDQMAFLKQLANKSLNK